MAKVSVIIPVYNVEPYLKQCMDSVVGQTLKDIEIICVDDGSTDGSLDILKEYATEDSRIQIIEQKNAGAGAARNNGMRHATGRKRSGRFCSIQIRPVSYREETVCFSRLGDP